MMFIQKRLSLMISGAALSVLLTACAGTSKAPEEPKMTPAEAILLEQIETNFHEGEYKVVIKTIKETPETTTGSHDFRTEALKYKAFSECVSRQPRNCRDSFRQLLALDPSFELSPAEANHPQWGKVFTAEKKRSDAAVAKAAAATKQNNGNLEKATTMPRSEIRVGPRKRPNTNTNSN